MYGVKRGFKAPGEFGAGDMLGLALAGASGIIAAVVADFQQKGEASALLTINQWAVQIGSLFGYTEIPLWSVIIGLTVLGAGSIFYFQPITRQGAFAQGFGLLAVMMTMTPPDLAGGIEAMNESLPGLEPAVSREASLGAQIIKASYTPQSAQVYQAQNRQEAAKYDLQLRINFPNGLPANVDQLIRSGALRGRLHNNDTNETWNLFRSAGGTVRQDGDALIINAGVPARSQTAELWVRIECAGYQIEEQSATATLDQSLDWIVDMRPSNTPLFLQRLRKSYRY